MSNNRSSGTGGREKENKKVILLDRSRTERAFAEYESLWDMEIDKIEERLVGHIESLAEYTEETDSRKKPLLSIAVLGYPGSGKTSMLRTLVERVNEGNLKKDNLKSNVYSLPVIKPNLVAEGDHFLYAFLAEALRADRKQHQNEEDPDREAQFISRVQHKFQEVSEYLQVLNKVGHSHEGDPLGVSLERLERHESGLMLIDKMIEFIDELAISLGGKTQSSVVLMPVDDADISQDVLDSALDTCWRFIKHPRLVPIFAFTGRLAEELLRVNYDNKLDSGSSLEKLREASTSTLVTENMAIQHLGKLFPVRNRIKMGPASARVQVARYKPLKKEGGGKKVSDLLKTASRLLFGYPQFLAGHTIRPPLRMVTLRRQIQILDAIQGTGIEQFMMEKEKKEQKRWSVIFDMAAWSLLNAHRDVLKEIHLNLDDLYSWTPKGLRQVILDCILMQKKDDMNKLHKHWRYRTEDRRSQIISLLAVNVFRPRMDEEPTGDDTPEIIDEWWDNYKNDKKPGVAAESFPVIKGALWFLNLCIGFYLPQVFSWRGLPGNEEKDGETNRVTGIGWGLLSGPLHAVHEALKKKKVFSSGMLFLDPVEFDNPLKDYKTNRFYRFFIHVWCYYGFHDEWPWAAVSIWRGLGLMGKVIEVFEDYRKYPDDKGRCMFVDRKALKDNAKEASESIEEGLRKRIEKVINRHFESARVFSNLPKGKELKGEELKGGIGRLLTENWEYKDDVGIAQDTEENMKELIPKFAGAMVFWLKNNWSISNGRGTGEEENRIFPMKAAEDGSSDSCFIRRLHGDSLMSIFLQKLENAYFKKDLKDWTAGSILYQWKKLLSGYWDGCDGIKYLLESCPIWPDFRSHSLYEPALKKDPEFQWGEKVRVDSPVDAGDYEKRAGASKKKFEKTYSDKENFQYLKKGYEKGLDKDKHRLEDAKTNHHEKKIEDIKIYNAIVEEEYNSKISVARAKLENYGLFKDDEKSTKHKLEGGLNILQLTGDGPGDNKNSETGEQGT